MTAGDASPRQASTVDQDAAREALVILNPVAGQAEPEVVREVVDQVFGAAGWRHRVHETAVGVDIGAVISEAIRSGCGLIVAAGGDGTVGIVAGQLAGSEVPLGILPLGTGNILARDLGIPLDLPAAAATIVGEHRVVALDAMRIGERHYFLNAGVGLPATVMRDTTREAKRRFGMLAYVQTAIDKLLRNRPSRFRVVVDGRGRTHRAAFVMVVNVGTLGVPEIRWAKDAAADDGVLDVVVARARGLGDYLTMLWHLWTGRALGGPVSHYRAHRSVSISAARGLAVQADGEVIGARSLEVRVVPRAVRIVVPREPAGPADEAAPREARRARRLQRALARLLGPVGIVDTSAFLAVSQLPHPRVLDLAMRGLSASMSKGMAWAAGLLVASRVDPSRGGRAMREVLPAMWLAGLAVEFPIKRLFSRARPFASLTLSPVTGDKPGGYSFPSSHTAVAFAAAWLLRPHYPRHALGLYALASLVGFSRLYLGVHYLSDVVVGAVSGTVLAEAIRRIRWPRTRG